MVRSVVAILVLLALPSTTETEENAQRTQVRDVAFSASGEWLEVAASGELELVVTRGKAGAEQVSKIPLKRLSASAKVLEARVIPFSKQAIAIALVIQEAGRCTYRFLHNLGPPGGGTQAHEDDGWLFSDPVFESALPPFRIIDVANPSGDSLEITFRRGHPSSADSASQFEERIYVDPCPLFRSGGTLIEVTDTRIVHRGR